MYIYIYNHYYCVSITTSKFQTLLAYDAPVALYFLSFCLLRFCCNGARKKHCPRPRCLSQCSATLLRFGGKFHRKAVAKNECVCHKRRWLFSLLNSLGFRCCLWHCLGNDEHATLAFAVGLNMHKIGRDWRRRELKKTENKKSGRKQTLTREAQIPRTSVRELDATECARAPSSHLLAARA